MTIQESEKKKLLRIIHNLLDGIEGYCCEGFNLDRFWKPEDVIEAKMVTVKNKE